MRSGRTRSIIVPFYKKGDTTICIVYKKGDKRGSNIYGRISICQLRTKVYVTSCYHG